MAAPSSMKTQATWGSAAPSNSNELLLMKLPGASSAGSLPRPTLELVFYANKFAQEGSSLTVVDRWANLPGPSAASRGPVVLLFLLFLDATALCKLCQCDPRRV